ncbi:MAG: hypothetical protein BWZ10_02923 [candidate division BRC1 bacterium ADurb.BinA364]|nr:MAG: hypothetical protein BWZ10_02923 [candidate division BRC1 bacterium ADurb.BinA364]
MRTVARWKLRRASLAEAPPRAGCAELVRSTAAIRLSGSIQSEVPVKPVWPNERGLAKNPIADSPSRHIRQAKPASGSMPGICGVLSRQTDSGESSWRAPRRDGRRIHSVSLLGISPA